MSLEGLGHLRGWLWLAEEVEDEEEDCDTDGHVSQHAQLKVGKSKDYNSTRNGVDKDQNYMGHDQMD